MIVLGINEDHVGTAALVRDGSVLACCSEERFTRIKNDTEYPMLAIDSVLKETGTPPGKIDCVAIASQCFGDPVQSRIKRVTRYTIGDYVKEMREYWYPVLVERKESNYWKEVLKDKRFQDESGLYYDYSFMQRCPESEWPQRMNESRINQVAKHLGIDKQRVHLIDHHTGHAHYAYYASPRNKNIKAAVLTADGWGDGCNATISVAEEGNLSELFRTPMCNLARIYRWITLLLGMKPNEHEYKVMGLAPYSRENMCRAAFDVFKETLVVDGLDFKWKTKPSDMYFYFRDRLEGVRFDGIAAGLQLWVETLLAEWVTNILKHTGTDVLYYSGGLSMNVKANQVLAELPLIKELHVPPSGGDESLAIGAAFALCKRRGEAPIALRNAYLGEAPDTAEALSAASRFRRDSRYQVIDTPSNDLVAGWLANGKIIGRCQGPMEFGARSLGNRAILCDPSKYENLRTLNSKIKFRDFWMPFTPSLLLERANDYIVNPKNLNAEFMTLTFGSTPLARRHLVAAIHPCDFTVRPQLVSPETNQAYYDLIKAFEKRTGVGGLLNTSFNLHGFPIVRTPADAVETLLKSDLDGVLLPGLAIVKNEIGPFMS
jgi:carbamoyltransferase